jgi:hypothetical protein
VFSVEVLNNMRPSSKKGASGRPKSMDGITLVEMIKQTASGKTLKELIGTYKKRRQKQKQVESKPLRFAS